MSDIIFSNIEKKYDIIIICAIECGSRAYGFNSDSSDYDIRYIYIQNDKNIYKRYLKYDAQKHRLRVKGNLQKLPNVKNRTITNRWLINRDMIMDVTQVGKKYDKLYQNPTIVDLHGWDITFAVKKLQITNPSIVEWMFSPIVYRNNPEYNFLQRARHLLIDQNRSNGLIKHYIGMGKKYFKKYIQGKKNVRVKKYMHCVRCCLMAIWIAINRHKEFQVDFNQVLEDMKPHLRHLRLLKSIQNLVNKKRESDKDTTGQRNRILNNFIKCILSLKISRNGDKRVPKSTAYNRLLGSCFENRFLNLTQTRLKNLALMN